MKPQWLQRPEGGTPFGLRLIRSFALGFGRAPARLVLYPITAYFLARRGPERRASRAYLNKVLGRRATLLDIARHVHSFSCTTLDRVFLLSERFRRFNIKAFGLDQLDRALGMGQGVLLFGSHLGSFDALRVLSLERPEVPVRILLDVEQGPALTAILNALNPSLAATVINARGGGPGVAIAIKEALDANAIVAVLIDRAQAGNALVSANFLGEPAPFPTSPWLLAATLKAPVILSFGLYRGGNRYDLHFETFADRIVVDRRERATAVARVVQQFADRLAHYARLAPYNWFNFYDFWHSADPLPRIDDARASDPGNELVRRS